MSTSGANTHAIADEVTRVAPAAPSRANRAASRRLRRGWWRRWRTMITVAVQMMLHDRLKSLGTLLGVVFAVVLSNQQAGTFLGLIHKNTMFLRNSGADLWIVPPATQQLQPGAFLSEGALMQARVTKGVSWAAPLLYGAATVKLPGGGTEQVNLIGARHPELKGGPWNLVAGSANDLGRTDAMIFEDSQREQLGGLNLGSVREVNGRRVQVVGFTWGLLPLGPSYAFAEYDLAREILGVDRDRMNFVLVGLSPGADAGRVRAALQRRVPEAEVITRADFEGRTLRWVLTKTPIGVTLGSSALFGLLIGFVIVALTMFSSVLDRIREFGILKAIGATTGDLARILFVQSVLFAVAGSLVGLGLVSRLADVIRSPKLGLVLLPEVFAGTTVIMIGMCLAASTLALWRLRKLQPAEVFK